MRVRSSLTLRLLIVVLIPVIIGAGIVFVISVKMMRQAFLHGYESKAESIVKTLDSGIGSVEQLHNTEVLQNQILKLIYSNPEIVQININLPNAENKLITQVSNDTSSEGVESHDDNSQAFEGNKMVSRNEGLRESERYILAAPIQVSGQVVGTYEIVLSYVNAYRAYVKQVTYFVGGAVVFVIFMIIIIWTLSVRQIINPIKKLLTGTEMIGAGNFDYRVKAESSDEMGKLASGINNALEKLDESYGNLENKVNEKTSELSKKLTEMAALNTTLAENKSAMINLLEDARSLEEQLKTETERMNVIIGSMGDGLYVVDKNGFIQLCNAQAEKLFGYSEGEMVGKKWMEIVRVYRGDKLLEFEERPVGITIATGKVVEVGIKDDYYYETEKIGKYPVKIVTTPLIEGGVTGAVIVFQNIQVEKDNVAIIEKKVEERTMELADEQAKLMASISALPRAFIIVDMHSKVVAQNGKLEDIFGQQKTKWSLQLIDELLANILGLQDKVKDVLKNKKVYDIDEVQYGAKYLRVYMAPVVKEGKELIGAVITIKDATEARVMARSKDEFFSIASHELRTPLTAIRGNTSMMIEYYAEAFKDPELKQMLNDTHDASVRLIGIVNDFLDMSRLEMSKVEFKLAPTDLPEVIKEVIKEYEVTGSRQKLYIELVESKDKVPQVIADRDRLKQVLINLIGNAIKFTKEGGIKIELHPESSNVVILVIDTGTGIPVANQSLLFRKFQQAGSSLATRDTSKGTGLGLYISRLLAEGMGGKLELVKSIEGKGSVFGVTLPEATKV